MGQADMNRATLHSIIAYLEGKCIKTLGLVGKPEQTLLIYFISLPWLNLNVLGPSVGENIPLQVASPD